MKKAYLGDSVYIEYEDGMLKLTTENGYPDDPRNVIYLEPEVYAALIEYVRMVGTRAAEDGDDPRAGAQRELG